MPDVLNKVKRVRFWKQINRPSSGISKKQKRTGVIIVNDIKSEPFNVADYLSTPDDIAAYLNAILEDGEPALILSALLDVVNAKGGMSELSTITGLSRESLYKTLSNTGNPRLDSLLAIFRAFNLKLAVSVDKAA